MSVTENIKIDTTDNQSDETYTTPISPLSPKEKSPVSNEKETTNVNEMQSLIQSSNDLTFPLEDSWSFWFFKNDRQCEWKDNLIQITTVSTVENFWSVYNHLQVASRLGQGCDYFLFKTHIVNKNHLIFSSPFSYYYLATNVGRSIQSFWWSMVFEFK
jgi:translation initiation factor 4E